MAWCFSTRASVATVLTTHPCVSRCLRVKIKASSQREQRVERQHDGNSTLTQSTAQYSQKLPFFLLTLKCQACYLAKYVWHLSQSFLLYAHQYCRLVWSGNKPLPEQIMLILNRLLVQGPTPSSRKRVNTDMYRSINSTWPPGQMANEPRSLFIKWHLVWFAWNCILGVRFNSLSMRVNIGSCNGLVPV